MALIKVATRFFTCWAMIAHLLFLAGMIPCTFSIAVLVCVGGLLHNIFLNNSYNLCVDVILHYIPLLVFGLSKTLEFRFDVLVGLCSLYALFHRFDFQQILLFYTDTATYTK